jgi:hypothetical protein
MKLQTDTLLSQFQFAVEDFAIKEPSGGERIEVLEWSVAVHPYPCKTSPLWLQAECIAVAAKHYSSWQELTAASWPVELRWQLLESTSQNGSAT